VVGDGGGKEESKVAAEDLAECPWPFIWMQVTHAQCLL